MAIVSISEAAKLVNKSRTTIYKMIEQGKLSKSTDSVTNLQGVDTSELIRVFGGISEQVMNSHDVCKVEHSFTNQVQTDEHLKVLELEAEVKRLNSILEERGSVIEAHKKHIESLDHAMRLLEDQRQKKPPAEEYEPKKEEPKGFFQRLFKG